MGNPTKYRGIDCSWVKGRQLDEFGSLQFKCDGRGRRTKKGDITFTYDSNGRLLSHSNGISFIYDNSGVVGLKQDGKTYIYRKDVQGNIIAILDSTGKVMVRYVYDVWGNHKAYDENGSEITSATHIGNLNPFRYRGYYYDTETKLYFLKTRYYDSEIGRFMTIDDLSYLDPDTINGLNLYAYCGNNPVMMTDEDGTMPKWLKWLIGGLAFVGAVALTVLTGGALAPVFIGMGVSILSSSIIQGTISACTGGSFWDGFLDGAADGALWGGLFALGGAVLRTIQIMHKGVVIGESMGRVTSAAKDLGAATYKAPGKGLVNLFCKNNATNIMMRQNQNWIKRMMKWGVKITDIGIDIYRPAANRSIFYAMESAMSYGYGNLFIRLLG